MKIKILLLFSLMYSCSNISEPVELKPNTWYNINPDTSRYTIFNGSFFLDENHGWIYGKAKCNEVTDNCVGNKAVTFRTKDGGKTWSKSAYPVYEHSFRGVHFFDDMNGIALFRHNHKSTDGGNTWNDLGNIYPSSFFNDIEFINDQTGWIAGRDGIFKSTDSGISWHMLEGSLDSVVSNHYFEVEAISDLELYAIGWKSLIFSRDGGESWSKIQLPISSLISYESIRFITPEIGWIGGEYMSLFKTKDGGTSWEQIDIRDGYEAILSIDLIDSLSMVIGLSGGNVLITNDAWTTYDEQKLSSDEDIRDIKYTQSGVVYAVGSHIVKKAKIVK